LEENSNVICIKLKGYRNNQIVMEPILVHDKQKCKTCGTVSGVEAKYCYYCGTYLGE
jgi:hypothetical protein